MRFEHLIEINSPNVTAQLVVPLLSREQLWAGLMARVMTPQRFPLGPERCEVRERERGVFERTLHFGAHVMHDEVVAVPLQQVEFTPQPHGDTTPIRLTVGIEVPQPGQMVLRFVYESVSPLPAEEAYFNEYRHNAWLHNDLDMVRTLRQWLLDEGL
ncbi:MAG: AtaL-like protein [Pseudomonadota bacterium]